MKYLWMVLILLMAFSCTQKESPLTEGYTLEGIIENPSFDKFFVSPIGVLLPSPTNAFNPTTKGYIGDTIWTDSKGFYLANYGNKSFVFYGEPGKQVRFKTENEQFDDALKFESDLADENNFLVSTNSVLEDTLKSLTENLISLDEKAFLQRVDSIQHIITQTIDAKAPKNIRPIVKEFVQSNYQLELYNLLNQYPQIKAYEKGNASYKPSKDFEKRLSAVPQLSDSMVMYLPSYRQILLAQFEGDLQKEIETQQKALEAKSTSPVYLLLSVMKKDTVLSPFKKDFLTGTFALQFDYSPENTMLKEVNDSLQKVIANESVKNQLQSHYNLLKALPEGSPAPVIAGKDGAGKRKEISYNRPSLLYFYSTADPNLDGQMQELNSLSDTYKDSLQIVSINFDTEKDWSFFTENFELKNEDLHIDQRWHSEVKKSYAIELAQLPKLILIDEKGNIVNNYAPSLETEEFSTALQTLLGKNSGTTE